MAKQTAPNASAQQFMDGHTFFRGVFYAILATAGLLAIAVVLGLLLQCISHLRGSFASEGFEKLEDGDSKSISPAVSNSSLEPSSPLRNVERDTQEEEAIKARASSSQPQPPKSGAIV